LCEGHRSGGREEGREKGREGGVRIEVVCRPIAATIMSSWKEWRQGGRVKFIENGLGGREAG